MDAPTSFLPPLRRLDEYNAPHIHKILTRLVTIYLPKVRGTVLVDEDIESLQSDEFERSFTIRWLTGFIARGEEWTELYTDGEGDLGSGAPAITSDASIGRFQTEFLDDTFFARTTAFDRATALLGACAGTSASGVISRELKFHTSSISSNDGSVHSDGPDSSSPITILLRDESISTGDHTAVGLQTWGSACILAERVARDPVAFGLPDTSLDPSLESQEVRVLELGAGTGLLSLLAGKLVERAGAATGTDDSKYTIIATDYHPAVLANLRANVQGNFTGSNTESDPLVDVRPLDWSLYLTGKPTTDLSRAPSTAPTPTVGTPISGCGQSVIEHKTPVVSLDTQTTSISGLVSSPPIQTPSFSGTSSASTPSASYSPQTPQTPRTARSPPPNLARAVFSRLIARGLKFEMPGGPPGIDQTSEHAKKSHSYPDSINMGDDSSAHPLDLVPTDIHIDPFTDSDNSTIEVEQVIEIRDLTPTQTLSPTLPIDASRSELLCVNHAVTTSVSGLNSSNNLTRCLDEIDALSSLDNRDVIFHTREDQRPAGPHPLLPGPQGFPIGMVGGSYCPDAPNKVVCLGDGSVIGDSADGTGTPLFNLSEQADGLAHDLSSGQPQAPHIVSPITGPTFAFGEPPTPNTIDHDSKTETTVKSDLKTQVNKDTVDPSKYILGGNTSKQGYMMGSQIPGTCTEAPFDQPFDVIFGADIVYELSHVTLVRGVVERLLRKPSYKPDSPPAYFHLIMPLRPTHADEANSVDMAFPRAEDVVGKGTSQDEVLAIVKTETYARSAGVGRADEVQYVHYCIGWVLG